MSGTAQPETNVDFRTRNFRPDEPPETETALEEPEEKTEEDPVVISALERVGWTGSSSEDRIHLL